MIFPILTYDTESESSTITVNQNILKYILFIQSKDDEFFRETIFLMSFDIHCNGKNNFPSHLMNVSEYASLTFSSNQALAKEFF